MRVEPKDKGQEQSLPWERKSDETVQAYARFLLYRNTPPDQRSIRKLGISKNLACRWSRRHKWVARASAFDDWLMQLGDSLAQHAALGHRGQLVRFASVSLDKSIKAAAELKLNETADVVLLAKTAAELGDKALGIAKLPERDTDRGSGGQAVAAVVWQAGTLPNWLNTESQTEIKQKQNEIVVQIEEKVLGETKSAPSQTVGVQVKGELPPGQVPKRLVEKMVEAPVRKNRDARGN